MTTPEQLTPDSLSRREWLGSAALLTAAATVGLVTAGQAKAIQLPVPVNIIAEPEQAPAQEGFVDVEGARLWYWDTGGTGEPIVLSHPATGSGAVWTYQQPVFAKAGYRIIGYSRRGYFKSEVSDPGAAASDVTDLQKLVQHLGLKRFHLVGSAGGSFLAAQYAVTYPQNLLSVVLGSSLINIQDKEYQDLIARVVPSNFGMMSPEFRELSPSYRAANPAGTQRWIELEKASHVGERRMPPLGAGPSGSAAVTFESLGALKIPMLLLTGDCDLYSSPAMLVYVAKRLGKDQVVIIDNAGHAVFWEQPETYNKAILNFIRKA